MLITADDVTHGKPHPEPYEKAAAALGIAPADCIVFEDSPNGMLSARRAGARVIGTGSTRNRDFVLGLGADEYVDYSEEDVATAVSDGDVVLDTRARTVSRGGDPVPLTGREYALVELLALHRGELVTRTQIYEHLFDENDDSLSNLIEVYVSNIRKKLGKDFITTRRGQGYVIDV